MKGKPCHKFACYVLASWSRTTNFNFGDLGPGNHVTTVGGIDFFKYTFNKIYSVYLKKIKSTKVARPSSIMIEVTNHCNLKCITCPREHEFGDQMDKGSIPIEELKKVVDQAFPYVDSIGLTGLGETMLYKPLKRLITLNQKIKALLFLFLSMHTYQKVLKLPNN